MTTPTFCGNLSLPINCANNSTTNKNPVFFKMVCFSGGSFGFSILPDDPNADFNWAFFDVTNSNPSDIFTNPNLLIAYNWSSDPGETGASFDGQSLSVCSGSNQVLFCKMPDIVRTRTYMLMVVNESSSTSPFLFSIGNGTASITDPNEPHLSKAGVTCDGSKVWIASNKPMLCNTISSDGSDFQISGGYNFTAAIPGRCNLPFGTDTVFLSLNQNLPNGNYTISMQNGTDGNTMGDLCGRFITGNENISLSVSPAQATPMDSIKPAGCLPGYIELVFKKSIQCNSIAPDGSDFVISGPQSLTASPANCPAGEEQRIIRLVLSPTNIAPGNYHLQLKTGTDGNTLLDDCGLITPAASLDFDIKEFVKAGFTFTNPPSCNKTTVSFFHDGSHNVNQWNWSFGSGHNSTSQNPVITFDPGNHAIRLIVSNGICTDTATASILTNDILKALFTVPEMACPGDTIHFENKSTGLIDGWNWDFGNGSNSNLNTPAAFRYASIGREAFYTVTLSAKNNSLNCEDKFKRVIRVLGNCLITVPSAFTPNGDGKNDWLYPLNALKASDLHFRVYDRYGQPVFATTDWTKKWDGSYKGNSLPVGVYAWLLDYKDPASGERIFLKGTTLLLR
jgi:gliding motility-associated-like protein